MSAGFPTLTNVGSGTQTTSASSATIAATPSASTLGRDLVVLVAYVIGASGIPDVNDVKDAGDGWRILSAGWDSTNNYGIILAALIAARAGASGYAGLTLPSAGSYRSSTHTYRLPQPWRFDLARVGRDNGWFNATASATTGSAPLCHSPYQQCIDILARGANNGGTTRTSGNITGFTERLDVGGTAPNINVYLNERTVANSIQNPLVSGTISAAVTNRAGVRAMIGIVGHDMLQTSRLRGPRRTG